MAHRIQINGKSTLMTLMCMVLISPFVMADQASIKAEATPIIKTFAKGLKRELKQAIQAGGPVNGLQACNIEATKIAQSASTSGWTVSRTSLKWRNDSNKPSPWEKQQLVEFERKLGAGEKHNQLWSVYEDEQEIRVMKAIVTQEVCIVCHGETLLPAVDSKLKALYPNDRATGFSPGDIRGAFSLQKRKN